MTEYRAPLVDGEPCYWCDPDNGPCRIHPPSPAIRSDRDVALSAIEENRRLRVALERYGRHDDECSEWPDQNQPCDCGFAAAIAVLPERKRVA